MFQFLLRLFPVCPLCLRAQYCRQKLVDAGLLRELMTVAVTIAFDAAARRYATFAVGNMAASLSTHPSFVELIPAVIELVDSPDSEIQVHIVNGNAADTSECWFLSSFFFIIPET